MPRILDDDLLTAFESRLRGIKAAVVEHWAPGLPHPRIDELLAPRGIDLPDEARVWWGRRNGAVAGAPSAAIEIIPGHDVWSLEEAAAASAEFGVMGDELYGMPEIAKHLRFVGNDPMIYVDCNGPRDAPAPIYAQNDWTEPPRRVLPSIGELIAIWIGLLDDGVFTMNPDGTWGRPIERSISPSLCWLGYR